MPDIKKNAVLSLEIESLAYGGAGIAKPDGFVVFVAGAVPGDLVTARVFKKSSNHAQAVLQSIERPSPRRIPAPCPLFGFCGGCSWQNLPYEDQLEWKRRHVEESLRHIAGESSPPVLPMIPSPEIWNYRNKMEFSFGTGPEGETILGFHEPGRFDRIFAVPRCLIHPEPFDAILAALVSYAREHRLSAYNQRRHEGFLRHALVRHSRATGGVMLALITHAGELPEKERLWDSLRAACPALQGFVWGLNRGVADVASIEEVRYRAGDPTLIERVNGLEFAVSPQSFFQTNTLGGERLYAKTVEMAGLSADSLVLDAYCGAGSIALHCAREARRVVGIEVVREAVWDARANAGRNGIDNATFISAPIQEGLPLARRAIGGAFTHVIIDPPRGGMEKKALAMLLEIAAPIFIYVSCNPSTLARDLVTICEAGYAVEAAQPVDMFPHTYHIETIVRLRKRAATPASAPPA